MKVPLKSILLGATLLGGTSLVTGYVATPKTVQAATLHSAALVGRCATSQLSAIAGRTDAGLGHVGQLFHFHNRSGRACALYGYPGALLLDGHGHPLPTHLRRGPGYLSGNPKVRAVRLAPGGNAYFVFEWVHLPSPGQKCPIAQAIRITPPNAFNSIEVRHVQIDACGGDLVGTPVEPNHVNF